MEFILWLQGFSAPWLDRFFICVTMLGLEEFYLLTIPLIYWCWNKRDGMRLATVFLASMYLNSYLKDLLQSPRPTMAQGVRVLFAESGPGFSFPSGHAQGTATFWGFVAVVGRRTWLWLLAVAVVTLVAISRPYLGLHFPFDVLGGALLGTLVLMLFFWLEPKLKLVPQNLRHGLLCVVGPLCTLPLYHNETAGKLLGFFAGLTIGAAIESQHVRFKEQGPLLRQAAKLLLGLVLVAALRVGLKLILPVGLLGSYLRYLLLGTSGAWLVPWLFVRLGLAQSEKAS